MNLLSSSLSVNNAFVLDMVQDTHQSFFFLVVGMNIIHVDVISQYHSIGLLTLCGSVTYTKLYMVVMNS